MNRETRKQRLEYAEAGDDHRRWPLIEQPRLDRRQSAGARPSRSRPAVLSTRTTPGEGDAREVRFPRPPWAPAARNMSSRRLRRPDRREPPEARTNPDNRKVAVPAQRPLPIRNRKA